MPANPRLFRKECPRVHKQSALGHTAIALAREPVDLKFRVAGKIFGQDLEGYVAVKPGVVCAADFAHSAGTQPRTDFILP